MGADFLFGISKLINNPEQLKEQILNLDDAALIGVAELFWGEAPDDMEEVRDLLRMAVDVVADTTRRDVGQALITEPGTYVVSGGMSWGDAPTEACELMWALEAAGLEEHE